MKQLRLCLVLWNQEKSGLFDFRTDPYDQKFHFKSYNIDLPTPKSNQTSQSDSYKFEMRKRLQSFMDQTDAQRYKLMGGFQIILRKDKHKRINAYLKVIPASKIPIRECSTNWKEKITHFLPYWIVRTLNNMWKLCEQQILKLGRLHLKVEETKIREEEQQQGTLDLKEVLDLDEKKQQSRLNSQLQADRERKCRVCLASDDQADPDNILINPCHCKGSIRYIHVSCLKEWLNSKLTKLSLQSNGQIRISDKLCCEICKMKLPSRIRKDGRLIPLMRYIEEARFIKMRPINVETETQYEQFYLLFEEEDKVSIGRLDTSGLLLNDQSVSREHSVIQIIDRNCYITDQQSKYGTLVFDDNLQVRLGKSTKAFQIESAVYCLTYS